MPAKKKSGGQQQQQNKKANSAAARHQQLVQDEPPTAAEALLNELFAENVRIVRDKTATAADVNQHIEKLHAMILKFGAALSPVATSIADALTPFLLARPPTVESAWLAASTAAVLVPSVGAAIFPAIIDHLAGSVDVQIGTIASTQSFSKEHGAAVIRDVFFRDLVALHQQYNTNSNSDAAENNNIVNDFSISKVRQCLRRISMTALPLLKPDQRVRYCFMMTQVLASATSSESRNSTLSLFGEDSAKHIYTSKNLELTKSSTVIDLLELASTALLLSRPAVVGVLVESINNLVARVKQARWCASAVSVHEACMTAAGVCSAILHPMASPSSLTGAEPAGDLLMASLSNSNNNNNSSTSTSATMHASPMFARSAVMPSNATSISSAAIITAHANNHSTTFVAVSSSTTTTTAKKASLPAVSFASDQQLVQGPPALLSSSRSAPARRSRSASRHDENGNVIEQNEIGNEGDDNDGSDLGDWDDEEDFAIPSSVDGSASKSNVAVGGKNKMGSKIKDKNESSGSKKSVSMSVPQNSAVSSNSHHHTTRVAPSPSPANVAANDSSNTNAFNDVAAGNIMFGSNSSFSSSSALNNNATTKQQSDGRSRALSRVNNASVAPTHNSNNSNNNNKIIMRGQPSTSPTPEHRSGAQKVSLVTEGSMSPKTAVVNNSNNANRQKADDDDDEDDDAGDIAI